MPRLRASFPALDVEQIEDAVSEALVDLCRANALVPESDLGTLLYKAAWRNARDSSRSERTRANREHDWYALLDAEDATIARDSAEVEEGLRGILDLLPDERAKAVFRLRVRGERRTQAYAEALGLEGDDPSWIRTRVKREKDRLDKILQREPEVRAIAARIVRGGV